MSENQNKVIEMFVPYENEFRKKAKALKCKWDIVKSKWYLDISSNIDDRFNDFRIYGLIDTGASVENLKELGCIFKSKYKCWTVAFSIYEERKLEFDLYKIKPLMEITHYYNYVSPPIKSEETQMAELIALMTSNDNDE
jgi:hypothetical protein